jgi:hypothetical protein
LNLNGGETALQKADKLDAAFTGKGIKFTHAAGTTLFTFDKAVDGVGVDNKTKERMTLTSKEGVPFQATIGYQGTISSLNGRGSASVFQAALGFDLLAGGHVLAAADIPFGSLRPSTIC